MSDIKQHIAFIQVKKCETLIMKSFTRHISYAFL